MVFDKKHNRILIKRILTSVLPSYYRTRALIGRTEKMDEEWIRNLQLQQLRKVLIHAYDNVPYYRNCFQKKRLNPNTFSDLSEIGDYPFLDKRTLRNSIDTLVMSRMAKRLSPTVFTGGTTGAPLKLYRSFSDYGRERAFMDYSYRMLGMDPFARRVYLRGKVDDANGKYYFRCVLSNTLYLSSNRMDDRQLAVR